MKDGCIFWGLQNLDSHCETWESQDNFLYNSDCICLKETRYITLGWLEGE